MHSFSPWLRVVFLCFLLQVALVSSAQDIGLRIVTELSPKKAQYAIGEQIKIKYWLFHDADYKVYSTLKSQPQYRQFWTEAGTKGVGEESMVKYQGKVQSGQVVRVDYLFPLQEGPLQIIPPTLQVEIEGVDATPTITHPAFNITASKGSKAGIQPETIEWTLNPDTSSTIAIGDLLSYKLLLSSRNNIRDLAAPILQFQSPHSQSYQSAGSQRKVEETDAGLTFRQEYSYLIPITTKQDLRWQFLLPDIDTTIQHFFPASRISGTASTFSPVLSNDSGDYSLWEIALFALLGIGIVVGIILWVSAYRRSQRN